MRAAINVAVIYQAMDEQNKNLGQTASQANMSPKTLKKILDTQRMPEYPESLFRLCRSLGLAVKDVVISEHDKSPQKRRLTIIRRGERNSRVL